jgi:hypothetical protein
MSLQDPDGTEWRPFAELTVASDHSASTAAPAAVAFWYHSLSPSGER